jgi:hypothetical protein
VQHDLADVYDEATCAVFDRWQAPRKPVPVEVASGWRGGLAATALLTAVALGVQDVVEPKRHDPIIEEIDVDALSSDDLPVVYHHVRGNPKASRASVRPWLLR